MKNALKLSIVSAITFALSLTSQPANAQYGGLQVQVGGYGTGIGIGGLNYGNGYYNQYGNNYGYSNPYRASNGYYNRYGNSYRYGNGYQSNSYYRQPSAIYFNGGSYRNYGSGSYPNMTYRFGSPRSYSTARNATIRDARDNDADEFD